MLLGALTACLGAVLANLMFGLEAVSVSTTERSGSGLWLSEVVATFGLLLVILGLVLNRLIVHARHRLIYWEKRPTQDVAIEE